MVGDMVGDPMCLGLVGMDDAIMWIWMDMDLGPNIGCIWHNMALKKNSQSDISIGKCMDQRTDLGASPSHLGILPLHQESLCHRGSSFNIKWAIGIHLTNE